MPSPRRHLSVDELSHRASTGLAIRRGDIKISDPIPSSYIHNGPEMDFDTDVEGLETSAEGAWPGRSRTRASHGRSESGTQQIHVSRFKESTSLAPSPATDDNQFTTSRTLDMQRSGSGFRATLKRMFSKKDRSTILLKKPVHQQKRSQALSYSNSHHSQLDKPHLSSHNISRSDALHSHAVSPYLDTSSNLASRQEPSLGQLGIRRNTVPSLSLLQDESRITRISEEHPTTCQRPKTAGRRPSPPQPQFKRRSRSADALADLLRSPRLNASQRHDRAEEIAYWRNSVLEYPMPPFAERLKVDSVAISEPTVRSDTSPARPARPSIEPVQDFDFGLNERTDSARPTTLQERVNTLEVKLYDFEYAIAKLQGNNIAKPDLPQRVSARRSTRELSTQENVLSATESTSSNHSPPSQRDEFTMPTSPREQRRIDRASKATTVRPTHRRTISQRSHASSPRSIHLSSEQYDTLYSLIREERIARQQLETLVISLQKEVDTLKQPVYAYMGSANYPTPSPDSLRNQPVMPTRPRPRDRVTDVQMQDSMNETSRFSTTETESDTDAGELSPDMYETPQETTFRFEPRAYTTNYHHHNMI